MSTRYDKTILGPNDDGRRLDRILRKVLAEIPLSRIYRALRSREITVNGKRVRGDTRVFEGDTLEIAETVRGARIRRPEPTGESPSPRENEKSRALTRRIVFENGHLLVVAKDRGELTHGEGSLEERVRAYLSGKLAAGISYRPGPVHRLDRNTSGLVIFGVSLQGSQRAAEALKAGTIVKRYLALFEGTVHAERWEDLLQRDRSSRVTEAVEGEGSEEESLAGQRAVTLVEPLARSNGLTLGLVELETGRTHQIRAQAARHGHPLLGDRKYGSSGRGHYMLHAASLTATREAPDLGFQHVWTAPPSLFATRIAEIFGGGAMERVEHLISTPAGPD